MIRARALDILLRSGARLGRDLAGDLIAIRVPAELEPVVAELRADLARAVREPLRYRTEGGKTENRRYAWHRCNECGAEALTAKDRTCMLTPRCKGKLVTYRDPPPLMLDGAPLPCARPGCMRPACHLTHAHEPLCASDFTHLALVLDHRRTA
jgi:hypothetical protein